MLLRSASSGTPVGVLVSGGLDSCVLAAQLLDEGHSVQPFFIRSGLAWEGAELAALSQFLKEIAVPGLRELVILELPLGDLYGDHWSITGAGVPNDRSPDSAVFLPGRNALLAIKAALWCQLHSVNKLALATLKGNPFGDATDEFFAGFQQALNLGLGAELAIIRPFAGLTKSEVMRLGRKYPLKATFSCIAPRKGLHCGRCNKCAERKSAFDEAGLADPTRYAGDLVWAPALASRTTDSPAANLT